MPASSWSGLVRQSCPHCSCKQASTTTEPLARSACPCCRRSSSNPSAAADKRPSLLPVTLCPPKPARPPSYFGCLPWPRSLSATTNKHPTFVHLTWCPLKPARTLPALGALAAPSCQGLPWSRDAVRQPLTSTRPFVFFSCGHQSLPSPSYLGCLPLLGKVCPGLTFPQQLLKTWPKALVVAHAAVHGRHMMQQLVWTVCV